MSSKKIAVIIPAYNVQSQIAGVIETVPDFVDKIFVVDDGSTDGTAQALAGLANDRVRVIRHDKNQGVGGAMLTGYRAAMEAGMDILAKMDGDGQMKPQYLQKLIEPLLEGNAHYVKGNRFCDYQALDRMPAIRRFGNAWLSFMTKMVSGYWNIFDVTNGYTAISAEMLRRMNFKHLASGYFFETSMLIELNICAAKVVDVEMPSCYEDQNSHLQIGRALVFFPCLLLQGFLRRFYWRYIVRDFNVLSICFLIGAPLFIFGVCYGLCLWIFPANPDQPTPAGTVMLAALPIILGFQLLLAALVLDVVLVPVKEPFSKKSQ